MFLHSWGLSALHHIDHSYSPCKITSPFNSDLITASFEEVLSGTGCVSNGSVETTGAEVHAINYFSDRGRRVELYLKDSSNNDNFQQPIIIILSSSVNVHWLIRIKHNPKDLKQHLFVVSKGSGIRFANKHVEERPQLERQGGIPNGDTEFLSWLLNKYGAVTSLSSFRGGSSITLTVGRDSSAPMACSLQENQDKLELSASAVESNSHSLEGCLVTNRKNMLSKHAYIIELKKVPKGKTFEVDLEIRRQSRQTANKEFWLVLKSPSHVTWHVHTRKVQGYINIVANSYVDMSGIRMHTVAVRSEELNDSGKDLLLWVEYYLGPVAMYASVNNSNKLQITLPQIDHLLPEETKPVTTSRPEEPAVPPKFDPKKQKKLVLKSSLQTECDSETVTVALDKVVLEMLGIKKDTVTLLDPQCRAQDNGTHIYIQTSQDSCGTNFIDSQQGKMAYINTLVLHSSNFLNHYHDNLEEIGSGDDEIFSGSGESPVADMSEVYMDDEDMIMKEPPLQIGFMCEVVMSSSNPKQKNLLFELELFQSARFVTPVARFPVTVRHIQERMYLQATITNEPLLSTKADNCWLSDINDNNDVRKYNIILNSCPEDRSVTYHTVSQTGALPQSQRLSFTMENYVKLATSPTSAYLKCYLTVCCIDRNCGIYNYPMCSADMCSDNEHRHGHSSEVPKRLVVVGPINILNLPVNPKKGTYNPESGNTGVDGDVDITSNIDETGTSQTQGTKGSEEKQVIIEGLDSGTVVGIAFAAFIIGVLMMGILWFIHTHSGSIFVSGPFKRSFGNHGNHNGSTETERDYGETTPGSSAPIST